jgi:hypothetical protein
MKMFEREQGRWAVVVGMAVLALPAFGQFSGGSGWLAPSGSVALSDVGVPGGKRVLGGKGGHEEMGAGQRGFIPLQSPQPLNSFQAILDNNTQAVPDIAGAVGTFDLMTALNSQVRTQTKLGFIGFTSTLNSIFQSQGNPVCRSARVLFNPYSNRWVLVAAADQRTSNSSVVMAVTRTNDPNGIWDLYKVPSFQPGTLSLEDLNIGFNNRWVVVTTNNRAVTNGAFVSSSAWVLDSSKLFAATPSASFNRLDTPHMNMVPAYTYDAMEQNIWLTNVIARNDGGQGRLGLYLISGATGSEIFTPSAFEPAGPAWQATSATDLGPQLGTSTRVNMGDDRIQNMVQRSGRLWMAHTVFLPATGTPNRAGVQWWEIDLETGVRQRAIIGDDDTNLMFGYPSIGVDGFGNAMIGFSRFSGTAFVGAGYAFRRASDPLNAVRLPFIYKSGESQYNDPVGGSNLWGRYSTTAADPANGLGLWTLQQYAASPANIWGTWWAQVPVANQEAPNTIVFQGAATTPIFGWKLFAAEYDQTIGLGNLPSTDNLISVCVDLNNDGNTDLVFFNVLNRQVTYRLLDANRNPIGSGLIGVSAAGWTLAAAGRFDTSGNITLVWQNQGLQLVVGWVLNENIEFQSSRVFGTSGAGFRLCGAADINNDGNTDLMFQGPGANQAIVAWLLDANGNFSSAQTIAVVPTGWFVIGAGDFTNDSIADLVLANLTTRLVVVFTGPTPGVFTTSTLVGGYTDQFVPRTVGRF